MTHNCDFIIKVADGTAYHTGRFNVVSEIKIFEQSLYEKNKNKPVEQVKPEVTEAPKKEPPIPFDLLGVDLDKIDFSELFAAIKTMPEAKPKLVFRDISPFNKPKVPLSTENKTITENLKLKNALVSKKVIKPNYLPAVPETKILPKNIPGNQPSKSENRFWWIVGIVTSGVILNEIFNKKKK